MFSFQSNMGGGESQVSIDGVLDHRLRRAGPGDLGGDRRDAVAEFVERQIVEDDVDQARNAGVASASPSLPSMWLRTSRSGAWSSVPR
jgi:hypothetical protein